ncbi:MAG: rhodanese-like domain-containing protein [Rhodocyclaceae bacterium]|nr:rhodanese-like domain-containing protein [Rhodocyclaceae bacterium]
MGRFVLTLLLSLGLTHAQAEIVNVDSAELARLQSEGIPVVDIRTSGEWQQSGVVPGAHLLTFFDEQGQSDPEAFLARLKSIAGPDKPVAVICRSGNRTRIVSQFLSGQAGYTKVYNAQGGMQAWLASHQKVIAADKASSTCGNASNC